MIDEKGRCCGRKPLVYKRDAHLFCDRCCRAYDIDTKKQIVNWAWISDGAGGFMKNPSYKFATAESS